MFEKEAEERYYKNYPVTLNIGEEERYKKVTDIWQDGAEFGYNKAKEETKNQLCELKTKKIPQLERKIASIRGCHSVDAKKLNARIEQVERLKKENAELLCQKNRNKSCYSCANATERCFRNEIGCPCQKYKSWKEENAELKRNEFNARSCLELQKSQDKSILNYMGEKLTKAKEIIREYVNWDYGDHTNCLTDITKKAEQFLKEVKE